MFHLVYTSYSTAPFSEEELIQLLNQSRVSNKKLDITGTYKVEGDKVNYKVKGPDGTEQESSSTIKTLTDEKLVMESKEKTESEWKKKK